MRTQSGLGSPSGDSSSTGNSSNIAAWDREFLDGGRERGARRKKVYGYLKAANELRQTYSAQWAQKYQDSDSGTRMPGDYQEFDNGASGTEEMMLFPSYGRRINRRNREKFRHELSSNEQSRGEYNSEELAYWEKEWDEYENENAIVDVDVRGWIYSPHRGPLNRKNRILLSLARRLSGIPAPSQSPSVSEDEGSDQGKPTSFTEKQDEDFADRRAESIIKNESLDAPKQSPVMTSDQIAAANAQLMERLRPFLTIPMAGTPATVFFFNDTHSQSRTVLTNDSGQFALRASLDFIPTHIRVLAGENLSATNKVKVLEPAGISLISDIDDTIKHSAISEGAKEMFRNTFVRDLGDLTIAGVKEWYTKLANMGVGIHYVSNSPWQLYPLLEKYFSLTGLPPGSFHLKQYSGMLQGIFEPTAERKRPSLERIIQDFPDRQFVLVGDSGEADLETYTELVLANPGRVLGIFIRDVTTTSINRFFDKSVSHMENALPKQFAKARLNDEPSREENKPALPPRRYLEQSKPESEPSTTTLGNLIDLEDDEDHQSPSHIARNNSFGQQNNTPSAPARPTKPAVLRGANIEQARTGNTNGGSQISGIAQRRPVPVPPQKPAVLSSVINEARMEPPFYSATKPPGQVSGQHNPGDGGYAASLKDQATSIYNRLPSAKEYVGNIPNLNPLSTGDSTATTKAKPIPPPAPPPRRTANPAARSLESKSTSNLVSTPPPVTSTRSYDSLSNYGINRSDPSSSTSTPQGIRTPMYPIADSTPSLPPNKREELWNRRWARANDILRREGVVLASWKIGEDVEELCFRLVKNAQEDIKQAGG